MGVAGGVDEDVGRRQAGVDDSEPVRGVEGDRDLIHEPARDRGLHWSARAQRLGQRPALDVLHRTPEEAIRRADTVQGHDVRVVEGRHQGGGSMERLLGFGACPGPGSAGDHLQRNRLIELQVTGEAHQRRGPTPVDGLELEQTAQVVARCRIDRVASPRRHLDGGHGSDNPVTLNEELVAPVRPFAPASSLYGNNVLGRLMLKSGKVARPPMGLTGFVPESAANTVPVP